MMVLVGIWKCQKKKAKQKHRNSASASADSRTIHRDWKDENSGFARAVLYAFDYRAPVRRPRRNGSCLAYSVVIQEEETSGQSRFKDFDRERVRKK